MKKTVRQGKRFFEMGRIESSEICALPGVLDDISITGLRTHFPNPVTIDPEKEYHLSLIIAKSTTTREFDLVCEPKWIDEDKSETEIGFSILCSPDTRAFNDFIENLTETNKDTEDVSNILIPSNADFIG
ncbi:MAG: hypothetical protein SOZ72_08050 [Treponema sp.]|nr:hypothetical protein [Treponema sp.]